MAALVDSTTTHWPPGLTAMSLRRCPPALREDAKQAAWLALAEGRKPDSAVRALVRHEQKHVAMAFELCPVSRIKRRF